MRHQCWRLIYPLILRISFPRVKVNPAFLNGALPGSGAAAAKSGWMSSKIFSDHYLPFIIRQTRCSKDRPVLLIMDNHESRVSLKAITTAKENGIVVLTLPPHTSHRLQPLDGTVYGPKKRCYNKACDEWLQSNPGRHIRIHEIAELTARAHTNTVTPANILSGFHATRIFRLNSDIFPDDAVTDRPPPEQLPVVVEVTQQHKLTGKSKPHKLNYKDPNYLVSIINMLSPRFFYSIIPICVVSDSSFLQMR